MSAWARAAATTIRRYTKVMEDDTLRNRKLLQKINSNGNVMYNASGLDFQWQVEFQGHDTEDYTGENTVSFQRKNRWKNAVLPHDRGFSATDAIYDLEKKQNRGNEALVKVFQQMAERLTRDASKSLGRQLWLDGNASGNEHKIHGIDSVFNNQTDYTSASLNTLQYDAASCPTYRASSFEDYVYEHTATYAGLTTGLGDYGGAYRSASGAWPAGESDEAFDFWSPLIVNYNSNRFGTDNTWETNCIEAIRWTNLHLARNVHDTGDADMVFVDRWMLNDLMNRQDAKERIIVAARTGDKSGFGFDSGSKASMNLDGLEITTDYGIPVNKGYMFNTSQFELISMADVLFETDSDFDIESRADRFLITFLGNMKIKNIRGMAKFVDGDAS